MGRTIGGVYFGNSNFATALEFGLLLWIIIFAAIFISRYQKMLVKRQRGRDSEAIAKWRKEQKKD